MDIIWRGRGLLDRGHLEVVIFINEDYCLLYMSIPEPKSIKGKLEACICTQARIHYSTIKGEVSIDGEILCVVFPWQMLVVKHEGRSEHVQYLDIAGAQGGVTKVERGGKTRYQNPHIPIPYCGFDLFKREDLEVLNGLRRSAFGEGFDYE